MESNLARLAAASSQGIDRSSNVSSVSSPQFASRQSSVEDDMDDEDSQSDMEDTTDLHMFRNKVDMADRYHGSSSLFVLCKQFRERFLSVSETHESGTHMRDLLHNVCEAAGVSEPFPSHHDQSLANLVSKQQAVSAVGHFLEHLDIATDIFSRDNLLANVERIYSQPPKPGDDAWAICFKVIVLLVLGMELSTQAKNALFGDFARFFLPSRVALVSPSLLLTPRLINVQTLILLSVAMQQFDPPGWAELIFTHACTLARTMGIHHMQISPSETSAEEKHERAKVLRSLYAQDKSLCITRGAVSWLPSHDSKVASQLKSAVDRQVTYYDRIQLSMIQDDIYRLIHTTRRRRPGSSSKSNAKLELIKNQLSEYASSFGLFQCQGSYSPRRAMIMLEFLASRILALQHGSDPDYLAQVRKDARTSCLLLLIAHGDQDDKIVKSFNAITSQASASSGEKTMSITDSGTQPFASIFDSFSVPAFFILLEDLLQAPENGNSAESDADLLLLHKISACYTLNTGRMQANSYHRKVSWIFEQLLIMVDMLKKAQRHPSNPVPSRVPVAEMVPQDPPSHITSFQPSLTDFSNISMTPTQTELTSFPATPSGNTPSLKDNWLAMSSGLLSNNAPFGATDMGDMSDSDPPDLLAQILATSHLFPDTSLQLMQWPALSSDSPNPRKRPRLHDECDDQMPENRPSPITEFLVSGQDMAFNLIP